MSLRERLAEHFDGPDVERIMGLARDAIRADPAPTLVELGLTAGGDIYRRKGDGSGHYVRCYYLERRP